ncbi:MAG TPA: hypothetical protein VIV11_34340 [Kofleriaceae bacterium]
MKTLAEIAIEAGLVTKAGAAKAGRMAEERQEPLVVILIKELGVNEVALIGALRKQTRVPLLDPRGIEVDPDALRIVPRDSCARLRVLPLGLTTDGKTRVLRVAMADPTDTSAILELEVIANCEIEVTALPLSAIDELVERGYKQFSTAVTRPKLYGRNLSVNTKQNRAQPIDETTAPGSEVSVTAQIPLSSLVPAPDLEARFNALCQVLIGKGVVTEAELAEAIKKLDSSKPSDS